MVNSADSDQMQHSLASHLSLHCSGLSVRILRVNMANVWYVTSHLQNLSTLQEIKWDIIQIHVSYPMRKCVFKGNMQTAHSCSQITAFTVLLHNHWTLYKSVSTYSILGPVSEDCVVSVADLDPGADLYCSDIISFLSDAVHPHNGIFWQPTNNRTPPK